MKTCAALAALLLAACSGELPPPAIEVGDAWARPASAGQSATAVYFRIENLGGEDRLAAIASPAGEAAIHSTSLRDGVMRMRPVDSLDVPEGSTVVFRPGGTHVMLTGLKAPLAAGSTVPIVLRFERSGDRRVTADVRSASATGETL